MKFSLRKSSIDPRIYEILENDQVVKEICISFKIYKWPSLFQSLEEIERWVLNEGERKCKQAAYRLINARNQSIFGLTKKLEQRGFSRESIDQVVEDFKRYGYLSDEDFSIAIIEKEIRRGYGPRYIELKLRSLGLKADKVRNLATEKVQRESIRKLIKRLKPGALQRRGFDSDLIFSELDSKITFEN